MSRMWQGIILSNNADASGQNRFAHPEGGVQIFPGRAYGAIGKKRKTPSIKRGSWILTPSCRDRDKEAYIEEADSFFLIMSKYRLLIFSAIRLNYGSVVPLTSSSFQKKAEIGMSSFSDAFCRNLRLGSLF